MEFKDRVKIAWAAFKGLGGVQLPMNGRSSDETVQGMISSYLANFGSVAPIVDFEMLKALKNFWIYNPDISQYVANIVNLGNPGHQLTIDAKTDAKAEAALNRLNEAASRIYTIGCGVDGLLNQYLTSVAWSGAISSEDVVNIAGRRVEKVVLVPVEQIRFIYNKDTGEYEPHQRSNNLARPTNSKHPGLIPLNPETYKYLALSTVENSPYAKPPATAAVEAILQGQTPIMENLRFMAQKAGLMGFIDFSANRPPKKPSETQEEYESRCTRYVADLNKALDGNLNKGLLVHLNDQKVDHKPTATGATGVAEVNQISEQQVMSGTHMPPVFFGRTDSSTETFADVVYSILIAQVGNIQRIAKRRQEQTYMLDLRLGGIEVDGVSLTFDKNHSRNAKDEAETAKIQLDTVLTKIRSGAISPDEGAQDLGHDAWYDPTLLAAGIALPTPDAKKLGKKELRMSFDRRKQRYVYQPERIEIWSGGEDVEAADNVVSIKKKALKA